MQRKTNLCLDVFTENLASVRAYDQSQRAFLSKGRSEHQQILRVLRHAMDQELTQRQRDCVNQYYFEKRKMEDVARDLGVSTSAVSRHLKKARGRLARVMEYAFTRLEQSPMD